MIGVRVFHCLLLRGMRCALVLLAFVASLAGAGQSARADAPRVALVIGIGAYRDVPALPNPARDARAIAASLRNLGFDVDEHIDSGYNDLKEAVRRFGQRAEHADAAVVYYAGHGMQVDHENFLVPADAQLEREHDLVYETLKLDIVLGEVARARKLGIVILDACRNNPFTDRFSRTLVARGISAANGLARVDNLPPNTAVAMATRGDAIAEDGSGEHSPYTAAILAHLEVPGLELSLFFRSVRDTVLRATRNRQEPYFFSSIGAEPFYFYPSRPKTEVRMDAIRRATEGNAEIEALVKAYVEKLIDIKREEPEPQKPAPMAPPARPAAMPAPRIATSQPPALEAGPPPPAVAATTGPAAPPMIKPKVKSHVDKAATDDKRKPVRDSLCVSIIERSQVGEQISDAERIYLQKCGRT